MKKIFIPWQLFRQTLSLRTKDNLESWLSRWRYGDDGAILIGGAISLNEDASNPMAEQNTNPATAQTVPGALAKLAALVQQRKESGMPVDLDDRTVYFLNEL
jgi:hypothetical protein